MKQVKVGIVGLGTVGGGTVNILKDNAEDIQRRCDTDISVAIAAVRDLNRERICDTTGIELTENPMDVANHPDVDIVVELMGGTGLAKEVIETAIANGKHIVTANKALVAEQGNELFAKADQADVNLAYEAAIAGGIPIVKALREGLAANKIEWLAGIINGTGNFIMTEMRDKGRDFDDVLAEAQALGYAEADPTFDVEGIDAAHKLTILASIAFGMPLDFEKTYTEGISKIQTEDVEYAERLGYVIKHLGVANRGENGIEMRVHPTLLPKKRLIANVDGVMNAVVVKGDQVGPTLYYGPGAGAGPTASAVVADIVDIVRGLNAGAQTVKGLGYQEGQLVDQAIATIDQIKTEYYLRFNAQDKCGLMANITALMADSGVSIEALIQEEPEQDGDDVTIVLLTNRVQETLMNTVIEQIQGVDGVRGEVARIRVETLD